MMSSYAVRVRKENDGCFPCDPLRLYCLKENLNKNILTRIENLCYSFLEIQYVTLGRHSLDIEHFN